MNPKEIFRNVNQWQIKRIHKICNALKKRGNCGALSLYIRIYLCRDVWVPYASGYIVVGNRYCSPILCLKFLWLVIWCSVHSWECFDTSFFKRRRFIENFYCDISVFKEFCIYDRPYMKVTKKRVIKLTFKT